MWNSFTVGEKKKWIQKKRKGDYWCQPVFAVGKWMFSWKYTLQQLRIFVSLKLKKKQSKKKKKKRKVILFAENYNLTKWQSFKCVCVCSVFNSDDETSVTKKLFLFSDSFFLFFLFFPFCKITVYCNQSPQ